MPALKDVGGLANKTGILSLMASPLWEQSVDAITPAQIYAFVTSLADRGRRDEAESAVEILLGEIRTAVSRGDLPTSPRLLSYTRPNYIYLTLGEIREGMRHIGMPHAGALLFALETGLDIQGVAMLTYAKLAHMRRSMKITDLAEQALGSCARHVAFPYVFWIEQHGVPQPLFGLEAAVFEAFGMDWSELVAGYENLIMIDAAADRASLECYLRR